MPAPRGLLDGLRPGGPPPQPCSLVLTTLGAQWGSDLAKARPPGYIHTVPWIGLAPQAPRHPWTPAGLMPQRARPSWPSLTVPWPSRPQTGLCTLGSRPRAKATSLHRPEGARRQLGPKRWCGKPLPKPSGLMLWPAACVGAAAPALPGTRKGGWGGGLAQRVL